jgi:hypothetical protein
MDLLFARLDPDTQQAAFTAHIFVPNSLLLRLPGRGGHKAVGRDEGGFHLTRFGQGIGLPLKFLPGYKGAIGYQTRIPLSKAVRSANVDEGGFTINFELPLQGRPSAFPGDWYELASSVVIWTHGGWVLTYNGVNQPSVPVHLALAAGPAMRGYSISMVSKHEVDGDFLRLVIVTDNQTKTLAYVIGSVPILLAIVAFILLVINLFGEYSPMRLQELAFTIVLGVLAVLPIRQVTVPDNLHGLTRVDLLLAFGVTMSVGVLVLALAMQIGLPTYARRTTARRDRRVLDH